MKIKFKPSNKEFYSELFDRVERVVSTELLIRCKRRMKVKFFAYFALYFAAYGLLFVDAVSNHFLLLTSAYVLLGMAGLLLAFNASHDAVHNTLFDNKRLNRLAHYLIFNLQGVNATLWTKRHISSHHIFPNVDGCDADIDNNPFIRLSKMHAFKSHHKFQHVYAPLVYCLYTLHWILIKDFMYLSKKEVANMKNLRYSVSFVFEVILLKLLYLSAIVVVPYLCSNASLGWFLLAFVLMHFTISIFFVLTLIISHLTTLTRFPVADENGFLPTDFYEHQLSVSLDYHPKSRVANWIFGGFNAHAAHHLFPKLPHTVCPKITPVIQEVAAKFNMPYNELPIWRAVYSHFSYLKRLGEK